ncbi:hypothetical protein [Pseudomonas sp. CGJS7]|uniref:hypothetical protein n=1 Tax=Pseudomonas sp. CGJS7 TaxID=3109348 RepID=UPI003009AECB
MAASVWVPWVLVAGAVVLIAALVAAGWGLGRLASRHDRLAQRADRNGRALLELADEIERYLAMQQLSGASIQPQRHWPRLCRRLAVDHLDCINRLMLDGLRRD